MDVDKKMKTKKKRKRTVISPHEMDILETSFRLQPRPDRDAKLRLARQLNKTDNFISIWFQNRRARERKCLSQPHAAFGIRSFSQSSMSEFSPAGGDRHGLGRFVYDQEEPLDLSDRASNQFGVGQSHGPVSCFLLNMFSTRPARFQYVIEVYALG